MKAWYLLLDARFSAHSEVERLVGGAARRKPFPVLRMVRDWLARRRAIRELEALDDRLLRDIGISRYEIREFVRDAYARDDVERRGPAGSKDARAAGRVRQFAPRPSPKIRLGPALPQARGELPVCRVSTTPKHSMRTLMIKP